MENIDSVLNILFDEGINIWMLRGGGFGFVLGIIISLLLPSKNVLIKVIGTFGIMVILPLLGFFIGTIIGVIQRKRELENPEERERTYTRRTYTPSAPKELSFTESNGCKVYDLENITLTSIDIPKKDSWTLSLNIKNRQNLEDSIKSLKRGGITYMLNSIISTYNNIGSIRIQAAKCIDLDGPIWNIMSVTSGDNPTVKSIPFDLSQDLNININKNIDEMQIFVNGNLFDTVSNDLIGDRFQIGGQFLEISELTVC